MNLCTRILFLLSLCCLHSCYSSEYGYNFNNENVDEVVSKVGSITKSQVIEKLHSPTFTYYDNSHIIFYASEKSKRLMFLRAIKIERKILKLEFDHNEILKSYEWIEFKGNKKVPMWRKAKIPGEKSVINGDYYKK